MPGTGNGVNGEIPQQPGIVSQQGASLDLANPGLPGASSGSPFSTISNVLGEQGAFQYLLGKNGYSLNNIQAKPSAQQAYTLLRTSGLEQSRAQQLLENNGYSAKNLTEPPASTLPPFSTGELRKLLNEPGLDVESTKRLMEREGYTTEPPNLLEGAERENSLQNEEPSFEDLLEPAKLDEDLLNEVFELEKYTGYVYNQDGNLMVTDDWKPQGKVSTPARYKPYAVVETQTSFKNGSFQIDRTIYDEEGKIVTQIHPGGHNRPDQHRLGKNGEHAHTFHWNSKGEIDSRIIRELTDQEHIEHADIIGGK